MAVFMGCAHYKRNCSLLSPCCAKVYPCRRCHDDMEDHVLNRYDVKQLMCNRCRTIQPVRKTCVQCGITFGNYACIFCNMFDDNNKGQFHCFHCGLCRVGGEENYFHCATCNMCINRQLKNKHNCFLDISHRNCPICLEDLHTSTKELFLPTCSHLLHRDCYNGLLNSNQTSCPTCRKPLVNSIL